MFDVIITLFLLIFTFILSLADVIKNEALSAIVNTIPIAILTVRLWYNSPRNYLKVMRITNRNVQYRLIIKLNDCVIDESFYHHICSNLLKIYCKKSDRIINEDIGKYIWKSYMEINDSVVEITYIAEQFTFNIEMKSKTKLKYFTDDVEKLLSSLSNDFSISENMHGSELIDIKIGFINKQQQDIRNPFVDKFFLKFQNVIFRIRFRGKYGAQFEITDKGIDIIGSNLNKLKKDIKKEMLLF